MIGELIMTEKEKAQMGMLYDAGNDDHLLDEMAYCREVCFEINALHPSKIDKQHALIKKIIPITKNNFTIITPFRCDYGYNIKFGENFYANYNCTILDGAKVTFGDNVLIAPNCAFLTAGHPLDVEQRNQGLEYAYPITIGNNVWIGAGVQVLPGVTIGNNTVIGTGSIVNKDIPSNVIAAGNPCRIIRKITDEDKNKYHK